MIPREPRANAAPPPGGRVARADRPAPREVSSDPLVARLWLGRIPCPADSRTAQQEVAAMAARAGGASPMTDAEQALVDILLPVLTEDGLLVEDVRLVPTGRRRVLKVLVDRDPYAEERP